MIPKELKTGITLSLFTALTVTLTVAVYFATRNTIEHTQTQLLQSTLSQLLPVDSYDNDLSQDTLLITDEALGNNGITHTMYIATHEQQPTGVVISATAPDGYNGNIALLIGLTMQADIHAVRVTEHRETPGLGDDIEVQRSDWILGFNNLTLIRLPESAWDVKKRGGQFDQLTGATITPRAIIRQVHATAQWFNEHKATLIDKFIKAKTQP